MRRYRKEVLVASLIAAAAAGTVRADCAKTGIALVGDSFPVNEAGVGAGSARAAWNPDRDEYLVVWSFYDGTQHLYGQRLAADGTPAGENFEITSDPNAIIEPTVAAAPGHDEYLVAWQTQSDPFNGARGIVLAGDGTANGELFTISTDGAEPELIYVDATAEFVFSGRGINITAQRIGLDGTLDGDPLALGSEGAPAPNGQMAANATGQVLALWRNQVDESLAGRRIAPDGQLSGDVVTYSTDYPGYMRAAYADYRPGSDDYVALYNIAQTGTLKWISVDASGAGATPEIVTDQGSEIYALGVARDDATGATMFLWGDYDEASELTTLSAQLLGADNALVGTPTPLMTSADGLFALAPARERGEALLLTWQDTDVRAQRVAYGCLLQDAIFGDGFDG